MLVSSVSCIKFGYAIQVSSVISAHLDLHVGMCAEAVVDQTRRRLVSLPQHEEFLWVPYPFEEPSNYHVQAVGEGQEMQLDRLARGSVHDPVIRGDHDRGAIEEVISQDLRSDRDDNTSSLLTQRHSKSSLPTNNWARVVVCEFAGSRHVRVVTRAKQRECEITLRVPSDTLGEESLIVFSSSVGTRAHTHTYTHTYTRYRDYRSIFSFAEYGDF